MPHVGQIDPGKLSIAKKAYFSRSALTAASSKTVSSHLLREDVIFPHAQTSPLPNQKHRKPEQSEDPSRFSTEDYAAILLLKSPISHENQHFFSTKIRLSILFPYLFLLKDCSEDQVFYL